MENQEDFINRYGRQLVLPRFNLESQNKLKAARVLIIGCGGLGAPVIQYLTAAGVGNLTLYDSDYVELSNLNRQVLFNETQLGQSKAETAANFARLLNSNINISFHNERFATHNAISVVEKHDLVIDCTDGLPNKYLINDACMLVKKTFIHAAVLAFSGRLLIVRPDSGCLRCLFEELPPLDTIPSCQTAGILGPICGLVGSLMAINALKILTEQYSVNYGYYYVINCEDEISLTQFQIHKNPDCVACGNKQSKLSLQEKNYMFVCNN